jgi:hypothetical protein
MGRRNSSLFHDPQAGVHSLHAGLLLPGQQSCKPRIFWLRAYVIQRISEKLATEKTSSVFSATLMSFQRKGASS